MKAQTYRVKEAVRVTTHEPDEITAILEAGDEVADDDGPIIRILKAKGLVEAIRPRTKE